MARVFLLGGTGVFGSRIARLLSATSEAELIIAGRNAMKTTGFVAELQKAGAKAKPCVTDRDSDLAAALRHERPSLLIDASGPFQECDYRTARLSIAQGIPYIDIADSRSFVTGIRALDAEARAAGVPILSGASSVPCLAGAVAETLAEGLEAVDALHIWISPGNRTPRGRAVIRAILAGAGQELRWRREGMWQTTHGWQDLHRIAIPELGHRWLSACDVPDLDLIPERWPAIRDATFHAGLELGILHLTLWAASWAPRWGLVRSLAPLTGVAMALAKSLEAFGSDRGGMRVELAGYAAGRRQRRSWTLIAASGHGPWVPAAPAAALAKRILSRDPPEPGARSCFGVLPLAAILDELRHLDITTRLEHQER